MVNVLGYVYYSKLSTFFKLLLIQSSIALFFILAALSHHYYYLSRGQKVINTWIMNGQLLLEMEITFLAFWQVLIARKIRVLVIIANVLFLTVYFWQLSYQGLNEYVNWADLTACIFFTVLATIAFYKFSFESVTAWWKSPEIWATLGLLIYFAGSVPFISMNNYLRTNYFEIWSFVYHYIAVTLGLMKYAFLLISFIILYFGFRKQIPDEK